MRPARSTLKVYLMTFRRVYPLVLPLVILSSITLLAVFALSFRTEPIPVIEPTVEREPSTATGAIDRAPAPSPEPTPEPEPTATTGSAFGALLAPSSVSSPPAEPSASPAARPTLPAEPLPSGAAVQTLLEGLAEPVAMAFDPAGRLFVIERAGAVRLVVDGALQPEPVITFKVDTCNERGLMGLALHPEFEANHYLYVQYDEFSDCGPTHSRLVRFTESGGRGIDPQQIFSTPHSGLFHTGNGIRFGPDGKLYVTVGDDYNPAAAQDVTSPHGKLHRINADGTIPADNPVFTQTGALPSLYAMGLRNSFDFTFDPLVKGRIFAGENGPDCDDELNLIEGGHNYGWRHEYPCDDSAPSVEYNTIPPLWFLPKDLCCIGPTGMEAYRGSSLPEWRNDLFMCSYNEGALVHFYLSEDRTRVTKIARVDGAKCSMAITTGPDGALYYIEGGGGQPGAIKRIIGPNP
jgi:glucose/arabinose dehydrogenase